MFLERLMIMGGKNKASTYRDYAAKVDASCRSYGEVSYPSLIPNSY